jgi:WD40 repeat protein
MATGSSRWLAFLVWVLPFFPLVAASPDDKEIERLVKQLGDDEFEKREEATRRLKEVGEPALDALYKAAASDDAEARRRARAILPGIEDKVYGEPLCLTGHTSYVCRVVVSADGKRVLTSSDDKTLRLWDADTGEQLRVFEGHTGSVGGAALSPDGKYVLSGSHDRTVRLWDAATGRELRRMTGHKTGALCVAFGPRGRALSGDFNGSLHVWDLNTGKSAGVLTGHTHWLSGLAYSDQAGLAATCGFDTDRSIRLWDLETGKQVRKITVRSGHLGCVCFSPDGKRLLSAGHDLPLCIWDVETGKELKQIPENTFSAAFSPDGKRIVSASYRDHAARVWDAATGELVRKYQGHTDTVSGVVFFPDGRRFVSACLDGTACVWRAPRATVGLPAQGSSGD